MVFAVLLAGVFMALPVSAQRTFKTDDLPTMPIDTLDTYHPDAKIITYTNNTWKYYFPDYEKLVDKDVFKNNWCENLVFSYTDVPMSSLPESVVLKLVVENPKEFHMPTFGKVSSRYGPRRRGVHKGIDICVPVGEPVYSVFEGKVRYAKYNSGGYGNLVIIRHPNGLETYYGHLCQLNVKLNDYVVAGQVIGYGGNTGRSSGPHLHFEVRYSDKTIDPERIIDFSNCKLKFNTYVLEKRHFNAKLKPNEALIEDAEEIESQLVEEIEEALSSDHIDDEVEEECDSTKTEQAGGGSTPKSSEELTESKAGTKPPVTPSAKSPVYHTVQKGDTLYRIARKYNTSVSTLCRLNDMESTDVLRIDDELRVK